MTAPLLNPSATEVTAREAARRLGCSHTKVARLVAAGILRARAVGRVYVIDVRAIEELRASRPELFTKRAA